MLLVAGASGFLGATLTGEAIAAGRQVIGTFHRRELTLSGVRAARADLAGRDAARTLVFDVKPTWVVNCAGFTSVDECETDPERAHLLNVELPRALAAACADFGAGLVHFSTDSVFDGSRGGYTENDAPAPINVYARTKLGGERAVLDALPTALVLRTNFIGVSPTGRAGLADWLSSRFEAGERISGFTDVVFAPLLANELARITLEMMDAGSSGIYHVAARDSCSKYEFARMLGGALNFDAELVEPRSVFGAGLAAPRPLNTSLSPSRVESALGRRMSSVREAVDGYACLRGAFHALATNLPVKALSDADN